MRDPGVIRWCGRSPGVIRRRRGSHATSPRCGPGVIRARSGSDLERADDRPGFSRCRGSDRRSAIAPGPDPEPPYCSHGSGGSVRLIASRLRDHSRLKCRSRHREVCLSELVGRVGLRVAVVAVADVRRGWLVVEGRGEVMVARGREGAAGSGWLSALVPDARQGIAGRAELVRRCPSASRRQTRPRTKILHSPRSPDPAGGDPVQRGFEYTRVGRTRTAVCRSRSISSSRVAQSSGVPPIAAV